MPPLCKIHTPTPRAFIRGTNLCVGDKSSHFNPVDGMRMGLFRIRTVFKTDGSEAPRTPQRFGSSRKHLGQSCSQVWAEAGVEMSLSAWG